MEKNDHIFEQIKAAAEADQTEFSSLDRVWSRVENKLDGKVLQKQNTLWKKLAVAASILAVISLGYHYWDTDQPAVEEQQVVVDKKHDFDQPVTESAVANTATEPKHEDVDEKTTLSRPITSSAMTGDTIAYQSRQEVAPVLMDNEVAVTSESPLKENSAAGKWLKGKVFEARSLENSAGYVNKTQESLVPQQSAAHPLVVIDGKAVKGSAATGASNISHLKDSDLESVVVLKEPLYIINGVEYTESSLFSDKPTSPYAPLSEQDILSIEILQDKSATDRFGLKGAKGVVIIKTQGGRPKMK